MLLMPDASTALLDPFAEVPTLSVLCEIVQPGTYEPYSKDPRQVAKRAEEYLRSTGVADTMYVGPECEFFVFDEVSYTSSENESRYKVDSSEGHWNCGTSSAVKMPRKPGTLLAAEVSMLRTRACGIGLVRVLQNAMRSARKSSAYFARPVTFARTSTGVKSFPMSL